MRDNRKSSEYIRTHLSEAGNGFELDDLASWHDRDEDWQDVLTRLHEINDRHSLPGEPRLGIYKPEARSELQQLAEELEQQGR